MYHIYYRSDTSII